MILLLLTALLLSEPGQAQDNFQTPWGPSQPISVTISLQSREVREAAIGAGGKVELFTARACNLTDADREYSPAAMAARIELFGIVIVPAGLVPAVQELSTRRTGWGRWAYALGWVAVGAGIAGNAGVFGGDTAKTKALIGVGSTALKLAADEASKRKQPVGGFRSLQWLDENDPPFRLAPGACYSRAILGTR